MSAGAGARAAHRGPAFDALPPERRWTLPLSDLLPVLRLRVWQNRANVTEQEFKRDGGWEWVGLPKGAFVFLRVRPDPEHRMELRIARSEPLTNPGAWDREVGVFMNVFGLQIVDGTIQADADRTYYIEQPLQPRDEGKAAIRLLELRHGEVRPGVGLCGQCGVETPVEWPYMPTGLRCGECLSRKEH